MDICLHTGAVMLIADDKNIVRVEKGLCFGVYLFVNPKQACKIERVSIEG
jgi:hypothetical protein